MRRIEFNGQTFAIIIDRNYRNEGIKFFTPHHFSQQLAYMRRPKGYVIDPHIHNPVKRELFLTKEVLLIRSGKVRVDFYDESKSYIESSVLTEGDVILFAFGGHGFEMLEESEIIEVKQGPYAGEHDKIRFSPVAAEKLCLKTSND